MPRRTKADAEDTRQLILDAAEEVFCINGISGTTLDQIAEKAGTTRGAIYWHFKNKTDLLNTLVQRIDCLNISVGDDLLEGGLPDHLRMLINAFLEPVQSLMRDEKIERAILIKSQLAKYPSELQIENFDSKHGAFLKFQNLLSGATEDHRIHLQIPASIASYGLSSLLFGMLENWLISPERHDLTKTAPAVLYVYLRGLGFAVKLLNRHGLLFEKELHLSKD